MSGVLAQAALIAGALACVFAGPMVAIWFLLRRKAKDRARRRSPLTAELLRAPGQTLGDQLFEADGDVLSWVMMLMLVPTTAALIYLGQSHFLQSPESINRWIFLAVLVVGTIVMGVRKLHALAELKDRLRLGLDGERAVGEELNQLMRRGAAAFHDVPGDGFNVDHVVIARETPPDTTHTR